MVILFLVFTYIWQEDVAKIFKVPGAPGNNMVNWRNHLLYDFQQEQFTSTLLVFKRRNIVEK